MPIALSFPGVYAAELPSGLRTIPGAATPVAACADNFRQTFSFADFERELAELAILKIQPVVT